MINGPQLVIKSINGYKLDKLVIIGVIKKIQEGDKQIMFDLLNEYYIAVIIILLIVA